MAKGNTADIHIGKTTDKASFIMHLELYMYTHKHIYM